MQQVNYNKHYDNPKPSQSTMKEALNLSVAKRTDFRVGFEGNQNKAF